MTTCVFIHYYTQYTAWVSIVQSRQLGTHNHFYVNDTLNNIFALLHILMACEKAGTSFLGCPVTLLFITMYSITASFVNTVISFAATSTSVFIQHLVV